MRQDSELHKRAIAAQLAEHLGGPAHAIQAFQELVVEQADELGLDDLRGDLEKVSEAAAALTELLERLIEGGLESSDVSDTEVQAKIRHDLRTPLNAIIGYSEMIAEELTEATQDGIRRDIAVILAEAQVLLSLIDEIVDFSRPADATAAHPAAVQARSLALELEASVGKEAKRDETPPGRILVIDDVASNRDLLRRRLESAGHEVILAGSGGEALDALGGAGGSAGEVDLILLDILMPDINGIELLSRLKVHATWQRIPVVMVSGLKETDAVIRCIEAGADDYLTKPFDPVILRARVNASLDRKRWADRERRYLGRIEQEKERNDALLHAILPRQVVLRLNRGEEVIADWFEATTILFADLVGFTPVAARMAPDRLVRRLDLIFRAFDGLAKAHGVEKIKTIGDAYMAAAGVPDAVADHADRALNLANAMLCELERVDDDATPFQIRIGIHSGPVVAGLLGQHRFVYDVWGETVNVASRLESACPPSHMLISEATRQALTGDWSFQQPQQVALKGVGEITAYVVPPY